jgi:DNA-binding transcriptional ArsR family regulator
VLLAPELDRVFESLCHRQRRLILLLLREGNVEHLNDLLVRGKQQATETELESIHTHLPKLEDAGYIEWDYDSGEIAEGPRFEEVELVLELFDTHADDLSADWP